MKHYILTTILDGDLVSSLHPTRDAAERELLNAVSNIANSGDFLNIEDVQPFFDSAGVGWSFQITEVEIDPVETIPTCDVCGATIEHVEWSGGDWCGECGCCREHCQQFEGCEVKEK